VGMSLALVHLKVLAFAPSMQQAASAATARVWSFMVDILDRGEQSRAVCSAARQGVFREVPETPPDGPPAPRRSEENPNQAAGTPPP